MSPCRWPLLLACAVVPSWPGHAAELFASDGKPGDRFGRSVSVWGPLGVVGSYFHYIFASGPVPEYGHGTAYFYRKLDRASGRMREAGKLQASDRQPSDNFGFSTSLHDTSCLVGAPMLSRLGAGAAYLFRDLDAAGAWVTETAKLSPPPSSNGSGFGGSVALWGNMGLVGARGVRVEGRQAQGAAYLFHNLDTATGEVTESVTLLASDGQARDSFGASVALGEFGAVVVAPGVRFEGVRDYQGAVYLFRDLEATTTGVLTETATLAPSGGSWLMDTEDSGISLWGTSALIKAQLTVKPTYPNAPIRVLAWLYRDLDRATGVVTESARLIASMRFPFYDSRSMYGASFSGDAALVGVMAADFSHILFPAYGTVYLYVNLGAAAGDVTEAVRLIPSQRGDSFGLKPESLSLDGDVFLIGDTNAMYGRTLMGTAHCGRVSTFTTLDEGDADREISFLSFESSVDWIIGAATSGNRLTLGEGDQAVVTAPGKAVYLGRDAGANDNTLALAGSLTASEVCIGAAAGSWGNVLHLTKTGSLLSAALRLAPGNFLTLEGDHASPGAFYERLNSATLHVWDGAAWQAVDIYNHAELVSATYDEEKNLTTVAPRSVSAAVPMPTLSLALVEDPARLQLRVSGEPGSAWVLQHSDDLTDWEDIQILTLDASGSATITESLAPAGGAFYRCAVAP